MDGDHGEYASDDLGIAIIGMAGRFPDARNVDEYWRNLAEGLESIREFTSKELSSAGASKAILADPAFVNAGTVLPDAARFDASFFGFSRREAEIMDPQHRVFLETAWESLENAGYDPERFSGAIGVYGGVGPNTYFQKNLNTRPDLLKVLGSYAMLLGNESTYAVSRVSFKLNLKGPSLSLNTACSTSAVAIHVACQALLTNECDMALAGGAMVSVPLGSGYLYDEGGILSPDGHCRAFDENARGTVSGDGVGIIVLKRLQDAIADGDNVLAVIKGSAINNDGSHKVGFTAPSIQGQATVIREALSIAGVSAASIGYVETHGTGTPLGDPIEIAALTEAFQDRAGEKGHCAIGSVKTNIGHLDAAAGVAGVIKTVLAMQHRQIPPSLNFEKPNPGIDFENSPFYVNTVLSSWPANDTPRRAGVSSFGLGGTNAHIILEEAPEISPSGPSREYQLLTLSASSPTALEKSSHNLADHLKGHPDENIADLAFTLQTGRKALTHRQAVTCRDISDAINALDPVDPRRVRTSSADHNDRAIAFMFSGQGSQYVDMGAELYEEQTTFQHRLDHCAELLRQWLEHDLRQILYPDDDFRQQASELLLQTAYTQPALFAFEYALASQWMEWGIQPHAMVGHSIGEYVAACLAGVFSLEDALSLVAARGRLMQALPGGDMLAVPLSEARLQQYLDGELSLAVMNAPDLCVVSGTRGSIADLQNRLLEEDLECRVIHTSHAFHSPMMDPILEPFRDVLDAVRLNPPTIPFLSNVSGNWVSAGEATDPSYWVRHIRQTVRFSDCIGKLLSEPDIALLEVGPGRTLNTLARSHPSCTKNHIVLSSSRHPKERVSDLEVILETLAQLWLAGVGVDWDRYYSNEDRHRLALPTYPFERERYWIDPATTAAERAATAHGTSLHEGEQDILTEGRVLEPRPSVQVGNPSTDVERWLAGIWQALLGVEQISVHDNFFEIGGNSLMATRLFTKIANDYGRKLPLSTIFEAPTIEELAPHLEQEKPTVSGTSLVQIHPGNARPPLLCLPGNMGNVFTDLQLLSKHLGADQPVFGFQDGLGHPSIVGKLASHYMQDLEALDLPGPYFLAGVCSGAVVAFEMAQRLIQDGKHVPLLALIEPATLSLPGANSFRHLLLELWTRLSTNVGEGSTAQSGLSMTERMTFLRMRMKVTANIWALQRYRPQVYPKEIKLFLTKESLSSGHRRSWTRLSMQGAEVIEIPGTHRSITGDREEIDENQMQVVGSLLRQRMDDSLSKIRTGP